MSAAEAEPPEAAPLSRTVTEAASSRPRWSMGVMLSQFTGLRDCLSQTNRDVLLRLLRGAGANVFGQVVIVAVQLTLVPITVSAWGLERYGTWLMLFTVPSTLALGELGLLSAAATQITAEVARGDRTAALRTFQSGCAFAALSSAAMALIVVVGFAVAEGLHAAVLVNGETAAAAAILAVYGLLCIQGPLLSAGYRCSGNYWVGTTISATTTLAENTVAVTLVLAGAGFVGVALGYLACRVASIVVSYITVRRLVPWLKPGLALASRGVLRALLAPAIAIIALPVGTAILMQGTMLALGFAVSNTAVAVFATTRTLCRLFLQAALIVNHALMPELTAAAAKVHVEQVRSLLRLTLMLSLICGALELVGMLGLGRLVIHLWTRGRIELDLATLAIMATSTALLLVWWPLANLILAVNRHATYTYHYVVCAAGVAVATYVLCQWLGLVGAPIAVLLGDAAMAARILFLIFQQKVLFQGFVKGQSNDTCNHS